MRALVAAARTTPSIEVLEGFEARRLVVEDNSVRGLLAFGPSGPALLATDRVVIATGGIGGLYDDSTNPPGSFGQGLALAALRRRGCRRHGVRPVPSDRARRR